MRRFATPLLLIVIAGCSAPAPDQEPPDAKVDAEAHVEQWEAARAARITFDRKTNEFVLTNVSSQVLWFNGEARSEEADAPVQPSPSYERQTQAGWVTTWAQWCATFSRRGSLAPGQRISLGKFRGQIGKGYPEGSPKAVELAMKIGDLSALPARVKLEVAPARYTKSEPAYSDAVARPETD
jgi:hypothetical protein